MCQIRVNLRRWACLLAALACLLALLPLPAHAAGAASKVVRVWAGGVAMAAILLLRTRQGILYPEFRSRYGSELLGEILTVLDSFRPDFFLRRDDGVALSPRGMRIANRIWEEIL